MKFLKTGKYLIAFALLFAIAATAVSAAATFEDTAAVPPDNTSNNVVAKEDSTTSNITVNMGENEKTYVELDKVNVKFDMDTEMTLENAMKAVAERAKEIVNTFDVVKVRKNEDAWNGQIYNISENISLKADIVSEHCLWDFITAADQHVYETDDAYYCLDLEAHPEYRDKAEYLAFVYLLAKTYPEDVLIIESLYERSYNCRRPYFGMMFCFDYKGKGYDTIEAYGKALRNGEAAMSENAYIIDPEIQHIAKCSIQHFFAPGVSRYESDKNLCADFFTK